MPSSLIVFLSCVGVLGFFAFLGWVVNIKQKADKLDKMTISELKKETNEFRQLLKETTQGFPTVVKAYEDYFEARDLELADYLMTKKHPARKSSEEVRQMAKERREAEKAARQANFLLDYCRYLAPWLDDYIDAESEELNRTIAEIHSAWEKKEQEFDEEARRHYGPKYATLSDSEKLQKKLDWYWNKPTKSNWQIGRDYERYIGYLYESDNWDVRFHGMKGYEDLGRDLICSKGNTVHVVQCKYWAREKLIHEKSIYYLLGTAIEYCLDTVGASSKTQLQLFPELIKNKNVVPKLVTTVDVSPKAAQAAEMLGVMIEKKPNKRYPSVKCNISRRTGERIFHLPFDQQYDSCTIEEEKLERYVDTIREAESMGFRHAYRWKGETPDAVEV